MDIEAFKNEFPNTPNAVLAEKYDCAVITLQRLARRLGLKKSPEYLSMMQRKKATGRVLSLESKEKISFAKKGSTLSEETKAKILQTKLVNNSIAKGATHYKWKGGRAWERFKDPEYIAWRTSVLERDKYICQSCQRQCRKYEKGLAAHHIKPYAEAPEFRFELSNGITLCRNCHMTLHGKNVVIQQIPCACGCGTIIDSFDSYGRSRKYVNHHAARGRPKPQSMKDRFSQQRKGQKITEEHKAKIALGLKNSAKKIGRPKVHLTPN